MSQKKNTALHLQLNVNKQTILTPSKPLIEGREARRGLERILRRQASKQKAKISKSGGEG